MTTLPALDRVASPADAEMVTRVLVRAFAQDPLWGSWAFPRPHPRDAHRSAVFRVFVDGALRYPASWIAAGDTAVALWVPPGGTDTTIEQDVLLEADLRARLGPNGAGRIFRAFDLFAAARPPEPHAYLSLLGTDPAYAGRGYGQQLLAHNLGALDDQEVPAYLDCADELVPLYERFGFRVIGSFASRTKDREATGCGGRRDTTEHRLNIRTAATAATPAWRTA